MVSAFWPETPSCAFYHVRFQVFQITLRDLSEGHGGLHRINVYFYDNWADKHCRLTPGETVAVSGPAASLVFSDLSASSGDHPFCLVFHTPDDDMGDLHGTSADEVKCEVIQSRSTGGTAVGEDESVAGRFGRSCSGKGAKTGAGTRRGDDAVEGKCGARVNWDKLPISPCVKSEVRYSTSLTYSFLATVVDSLSRKVSKYYRRQM